MNDNSSIEAVCRECGATHHVNISLAGRRVRCPHCDAHVDVPVASAAVLDEPAAPVMPSTAVEPASVTSLTRTSATDPLGTPGANAEPDSIEATAWAEPFESVDEEEDEPIPQRPEFHDEELDMTPMVDVTFLLLIFFMVTASFSLQKSIESARQQSEAASSTSVPQPTDELDTVTVQINELGSFLVMAPDWERETPGKQNLVRALREALGADRQTPMKLVIEVHEAAKLQALVDCMDAGTLSDYGEIQVIQVEGFE